MKSSAKTNANWIYEQTELNVAQFDKAMQIYCADSSSYLHDPQKYLARICDQCNYLDAVKLINWHTYIKANTTIMDIGSGGGWLAGYLSTFESVTTIYTLDSSKYFLLDMMPKIISLMNGNKQKIVPIEGLFTPLLFQDEFLDIVVASSALHHADNLESVLKEIRRTLKRGGYLLILNETPGSGLRHLLRVSKAFCKIFANLLFQNYKSVSASISSSGFLYDPHLGDRAYPLWYWQDAIERSGFTMIKPVNTGLPTVKNGSGPGLVHFICRAI